MERLTIRTNEASISFECESVGDIVRRLAACEAIQVAAMCKKFLEMEGKK